MLALVTTLEDGTPIVRVLPITPSRPGRMHEAIEIPPATKCRRGLDYEPLLDYASETNRFPLSRTGYPVQRQRLFRAVAADGVCRGEAPQFPPLASLCLPDASARLRLPRNSGFDQGK
ncbi:MULTISPECIES: hypothetical protein [Sinorhizobium]|uniref:hypothetical protein n=1 Tax=Sinorhizobium TaxID=28105 RepID=UPI0015967321|nr:MULTISPECIES: hypothetical protein [Sinorhizobium]